MDYLFPNLLASRTTSKQRNGRCRSSYKSLDASGGSVFRKLAWCGARCFDSRRQLNGYVLLGASMNTPKESNQKIVVGFAWYRREQWERVRDIASDAGEFEDTYEEWLRVAEQKLSELAAAGLDVKKVDVDSEQLILWCNEQGLDMNAQARSRYAAEKLRDLD